MGEYANTISFAGVTLQVTNITPIKAQKTRKTIVGKTLVEVKIIGMGAQQWELTVDGIVTGTTSTTLSTNRAAIEALDDSETHAWVDGIHDCTAYLVPGSLSFKDSNDRGNMSYTYSFKIVED